MKINFQFKIYFVFLLKMASWNKTNYLDSITLRKCPYSQHCPQMRDCKYLKHLDICPHRPISNETTVPQTNVIVPDYVSEEEVECVWVSDWPKYTLYKEDIEYRNPSTYRLLEMARMYDGYLPPELYNPMSKAARNRFNNIRCYLTKLKIRREQNKKLFKFDS